MPIRRHNIALDANANNIPVGGCCNTIFHDASQECDAKDCNRDYWHKEERASESYFVLWHVSEHAASLPRLRGIGKASLEKK